MYPYNFKRGQRIQTNVDGVACDRGFLAHFQVTADAAVAASNTGVRAAITLTGAVQVITAGITSPAVCRALQIKGNQAGVADNVVIEGTNYAGETIIETIAANGSTVVEGNKAFKTVTKITVPVLVGAGDTISVGWNDKLGLPYKLAHNTVVAAIRNNVREVTAPTVTVSATAMESNTCKLASALAGTIVDVYLIV